MILSSPAFKPGGPIPAQYTCEGPNVSPPLEWSGVPEETRSLALIVDDPDAPDPKAPRGTYVHWVLYGIPPSIGSLAEGAVRTALPSGSQVGVNDFKFAGYGGPCPPIGRHRYYFKLYALSIELPRMKNATKKDVEKAMEGRVIASAELVGTYEKQGTLHYRQESGRRS
jgi:Raf kinase inhibitor-like YbhB/YbcL family protein